jgi:hypothetical protein
MPTLCLCGRVCAITCWVVPIRVTATEPHRRRHVADIPASSLRAAWSTAGSGAGCRDCWPSRGWRRRCRLHAAAIAVRPRASTRDSPDGRGQAQHAAHAAFNVGSNAEDKRGPLPTQPQTHDQCPAAPLNIDVGNLRAHDAMRRPRICRIWLQPCHHHRDDSLATKTS